MRLQAEKCGCLPSALTRVFRANNTAEKSRLARLTVTSYSHPHTFIAGASMRRIVRSFLFFSILILLTCTLGNAADSPRSSANAQFHYQKPPKVVADVLESPASPTTVVSPTRDRVVVINSLRQPPISDLAAPMLRIGGLRINPATNGRHHPPHHVGFPLSRSRLGRNSSSPLRRMPGSAFRCGRRTASILLLQTRLRMPPSYGSPTPTLVLCDAFRESKSTQFSASHFNGCPAVAPCWSSLFPRAEERLLRKLLCPWDRMCRRVRAKRPQFPRLKTCFRLRTMPSSLTITSPHNWPVLMRSAER